MSFPAYPTYKDSGVEWLGDVPSHWRVQSLKRVAEFQTGSTPPTGRDDLYGGENQWVTIGDLEDRVIFNSTKQITDEAIDLVGISPSPKGSLLFSFKLSIGQVAFAGRDLFTNEAIATFFSGHELNLSFAYYALPVFVVQNAAENIYGAKLLNQELIRNARIAMPTAIEQASVATFLDRETTKIDALMEEQQRLIALLKEKRQTVISHAVTKGLNPDAPMKRSGVEWLGEVPAHWDVRRIKTILRGIKQGWSPQCEAEPVDSFDLWGVLKVGCVNGGHFNPTENKALPPELVPLPELAVRKGDVLVSRANTRDLVGSAALVESDYERLLLSDKLYCLNADRAQIDPGFLALYLQADAARGQIELAATGASSSMLNIGQAVIREMPIALPSLKEQQEILSRIKQRRVAFISLVSEANNAISILNERRAALISAAVTGKIDVRGSSQVLPFPIDRARARRLIAAEIIDRSAHQATFGRTKLQKLLYLVEAHANVNELAGRYVRMPYGPLDQDMIDEIEAAAADAGFAVDDPGNRKMVRYRTVATRSRDRGELAVWLGDDRVAKVDKLITDFADLDTHAAEAVATLYAVWNDALIDGEAPSDDRIVHGFLTQWNKTKTENFNRHELPHWLGWMRRHGLIPSGTGPKTSIGGLFA